MISFIYPLEIIIAVMRGAKFKGRRSDPNIFFWIDGSIADNAAAVNPNDIKTLLTNGFNTFFIKSKPVFSNGPKIIPRNPPDCPI